ncbi:MULTISPECIES: zinc finger domain-containing protein [unclassified Methanosarcina]|uniref:zinc finger domain-containing protein n=1 Tax=unclassified Methanosarcina TaxID=2644672 RepID=UPI0009E5ADA7|nr:MULTISPECIES: zinc finger domain-containing protein [unclassified Methanosarcina]
MFEFPSKCARCGTPLKKQVIGSNNFYYCRKCGCTSSVTSISATTQSAVQETANI